MYQKLPATFGLIGLNVLLFLLAGNLLPAGNILEAYLPLYFPKSQDFRIWQLVTHIFMHANTTHLLFNMFGLFSFGSILERVWGVRRFLIFYFVAGIGAGLIYTGVNYAKYQSTNDMLMKQGVARSTLETFARNGDPQIFAYQLESASPGILEGTELKKIKNYVKIVKGSMLGASGAIYGILTAFGLLFPDAKLSLIFLPIPVAAKYFIPVLLLLDFFSGITGFSIFGGGIAHFAHLGGALIGFLLMLLWRKDVPRLQVVSPVMEP